MVRESVSDLGRTEAQRELAERRYGMFIHFGVNTFNEIEWSDGTLPASSYAPTELDCDQWIREAKDAGFRHVVLVTKHHDGFLMWPSAHGDYGVAHSPVTVDVVGAVAEACRKYGVELGLYYSLWDRHDPAHDLEDPAPYVEVMKTHLTELLTQYGDVCELWFDGGWAKPAEDWRLDELYALVKDIQPRCLITCNHTVGIPGDPDKMRRPSQAQYGDPLRYWPVDFRTWDPNYVHADDPKVYTAPDGRLVYLPFEHTVCLSSRANWFQKAEPVAARELDELEELFHWCTAHQNALLLNVPPGRSGRIESPDLAAIAGLADRLGIRGGHVSLPATPLDHAQGAVVTSSGDLDPDHAASNVADGDVQDTRWIAADREATLTLTLAAPVSADRVVLHEHFEVEELGDGFSQVRTYEIDQWRVEILKDDGWRQVASGTSIGAVGIVRLERETQLSGVRVHVRGASANPSLVRLAVTQSR